jgi:hypothetical protein
MARNRIGLAYFPVDVDIFENKKLIKLGLKFHELGEVVYIRLLTMIYKNGYYLKISIDDLALILAKQIPSRIRDIAKIKSVIQYISEVDLINKEMAMNGVITSKGIQEQYIDSTKRRGELEQREYWLLDKTCIQNNQSCIHNVYKNGEVVDNNEENEYNLQQSKVKYSTVNKSTVDNSKKEESSKESVSQSINIDSNLDWLDRPDMTDRFIHPLTQYIIDKGYISSNDPAIADYNKYFMSVGYEISNQSKGLTGKQINEELHEIIDYVITHNKDVIKNKFAYLISAISSNWKSKQYKKADEVQQDVKPEPTVEVGEGYATFMNLVKNK